METIDGFPTIRTGFPAGPQPRPATTETGVHLDPEEEAALFGADPENEDEGPDLPDVGPDGFWPGADDWDRHSAAMSLWIDGHGPHPDRQEG